MSPMNSWKSMGPAVVSALKLGAIEPRRSLQYLLDQITHTQRALNLTYGAGRSSPVEPILAGGVLKDALLIVSAERPLNCVKNIQWGSNILRNDGISAIEGAFKYMLVPQNNPSPCALAQASYRLLISITQFVAKPYTNTIRSCSRHCALRARDNELADEHHHL